MWRGPSWFSGREPDAGKLAGNVDMPTSPAEKYSPTAIVSKEAAQSSTTGQYATVQGSVAPSGAIGASNPYSATPPAATSTVNTVAGTSVGGLAAQANGYQTGPYTTTSATNPNAGFVSPYGGSYTGVGSTTTPNVAITNPTSGLGALPTNASGQSLTNIANNGNISGSTSAALPTDPNLSGGLVAGTTGTTAFTTSSSIPSYPGLNPSTTAASTIPTRIVQTPQASAYQAASSTSSSFAPGTTGRTTTYNFGTTSSSQPSPAQPAYTLPPNTAGNQLLIR